MKLELSLRRRLGDFKFSADFALEGNQFGVFGPSGSGKSTLMNLLAGLLKPEQGYIRMNRDTLYDSFSGVNVLPEERRIGVVFQHAHLFPHMGVRQNLLYGYRRIPRKERKIELNSLVDVLGLGPLLERGVNGLSGGERQRVALGRTLLSSPRLILLDEPLTGLDTELKYQIIPYLKKVFTEFGIPLIFISHSINEMRLMTEQVLEFSGGCLTGQTSAEDLARRQMGSSQVDYANLLELRNPRPHEGLFVYRWGSRDLILLAGREDSGGMFELPSKEVTLFKRHPEATSARNLLPCRVQRVFGAGNRFGVELDCGGRKLVSQVVGEAVAELGLKPGTEVVAVIKASAFRRLY